VSYYNCTATIYSAGSDKNIIIKSSEQHNYVGNSPNKLERQVSHKSCKKLTEESLSTQPLKFIRNEF